MKRELILIVSLMSLCVSSSGTARAQTALQNSRTTFLVDDKGTVSSEINIVFPQTKSADNKPLDNYGLWVIALPLTLNEKRRISKAVDVHLAQLQAGREYTLFALTAPRDLATTTIKIDDASVIAETPDGKGKFEIDLSYPFMTQAERDLLNSPVGIKAHDISIVLPKRYDESDINPSPPSFTKVDEKTFLLTADQINKTTDTKVRISFPNPIQRSLDLARLTVSILFGLFTLLLQIPQLKGGRLWWFILVFIASSVILFVVAYFGVGLAKRIEFLISVAVLLPNVVYSFFASIYLLIAKKYQASVSGQITISNAPGKFVQVELHRKHGASTEMVARKEELLDGGRYIFNVWRVGQQYTYQIVARYSGTEGKSNEFTVVKGEKKEVPVINFVIPAQMVREEIRN